MTIRFNIMFNGFVLANGNMAHLPRVGEKIKIRNQIYKIDDIVYDYDDITATTTPVCIYVSSSYKKY